MQTHFAPFRPIKLVVAYPWGKQGDGSTKNPRIDERWRYLREKAGGVANEVRALAEKRLGAVSLEIRVSRLRGRHGSLLLPELRERIRSADILLMDMGTAEHGARGCDFNPNVLIEIGIALGASHLGQGSLFILKPFEVAVPSDLSGFLFTDYEKSKAGGIKLLDDSGFRAALRAKLVDIALSRSMLGAPRKPTVESEPA